jgi:chromosome partitioning protein
MRKAVITLAQQKGGAGKSTIAANLAVALVRAGGRVALIDTDPQGSLGRWHAERAARRPAPGLSFAAVSAWGLTLEIERAARAADIVIVDTPPRLGADLRPALRAADLVVIPVAASHLDLWTLGGVLDLCARESAAPLVVLNRARRGGRVADAVAAEAAAAFPGRLAASRLGDRTAFVESFACGGGVAEGPAGPARREIEALAAEVLDRLGKAGAGTG